MLAYTTYITLLAMLYKLLFSFDTNKESNLYRTCIFSDHDKILFLGGIHSTSSHS